MLAEVIRILPAIRKEHDAIGSREILVSVIYSIIGGGAVLFGWSDPQRAISVAVIGAAFPSLFSNAVRAASAPRKTSRGPRVKWPCLSA